MAQNDTLNAKELALLEALLSGETKESAADLAGFSRRQLYRVIERPAFSSELKRRQGDLLDLTARRLSALAVGAVDALEEVMADPGQHGANNKRLAAVAVLTVLHNWVELVDVERRLSLLEERSKRGGE